MFGFSHRVCSHFSMLANPFRNFTFYFYFHLNWEFFWIYCDVTFFYHSTFSTSDSVSRADSMNFVEFGDIPHSHATQSLWVNRHMKVNTSIAFSWDSGRNANISGVLWKISHSNRLKCTFARYYFHFFFYRINTYSFCCWLLDLVKVVISHSGNQIKYNFIKCALVHRIINEKKNKQMPCII